jgi:hypothetical protein
MSTAAPAGLAVLEFCLSAEAGFFWEKTNVEMHSAAQVIMTVVNCFGLVMVSPRKLLVAETLREVMLA